MNYVYTTQYTRQDVTKSCLILSLIRHLQIYGKGIIKATQRLRKIKIFLKLG
jgi:hypothetical protein